MAVTLVATPGATNANSYCTLAEADTYHGGRLNNATWTTAVVDTKVRALITAPRRLDEWIKWAGSSFASTQALLWPRLDVFDRHGLEFSSDVIPQFLKDATAEFALFLLLDDRQTDPDTFGFSEIGVGSINLKVDKHDRRHVVPDSVWSMVQFYGEKRSTRPNSVRLVRA